MNTSRARGFASLLILAIIAGLIALGGAGWYARSHLQKSAASDNTPVVALTSPQSPEETASSSAAARAGGASSTPLFSKDSSHVYCRGQMIAGADPGTAVITSNRLSVVVSGKEDIFDTNCDFFVDFSQGTASIAPIPQVIDMIQQVSYKPPTGIGRLLLYSGTTELIPISNVPKGTAAHICFESGADRCLYEGGSITPDSSPVSYSLSILAPAADTVISRTYVSIKLRDGGPAGEYHVYLKHYGDHGVDQVYEAHLTAVSGVQPTILSWDTRGVAFDGNSTLSFKSLPPGLYSLAVVNISTAASSEVFIQMGDTSSSSYIKPYSEGTPLYSDATWDGRGFLMDGKGGVDTLQLPGRESEYQIYRGQDMPAKDQYNTIVIRQNATGAVFVATNVEILKFDDVTLGIPSLSPIAR
jgi:hypothetical protein